MSATPILKRLAWVMNHPTLYALWQAPYKDTKMAPVERHNDLASVRRVLDIGCGPGTNADRFSHTRYLGIDENAAYIERARRRFAGTFQVADARTFEAPDDRFDFILINSLLHHLGTADVRAILRQMSDQLTADGHVHVIDLVLPEHAGIAHYLARSDRGDHARPLSAWRELFAESFVEDVFEPFFLRFLGSKLWYLVYFKGHARRARS